jgi:hypothetical protein
MQNLGRRTGPYDVAIQAGLPGPGAVLLADVTGGVNSTADFDFASLTIPAGFSVAAGMTWIAEAMGTFTKASGGMNIVNWIKINGTKVATTTLAQGNSARTGDPFQMRGGVTLRSIGATGVVAATLSILHRESTTVEQGVSSGSLVVDTANAITITVGGNLSVANAGHAMTATYARVGQ